MSNIAGKAYALNVITPMIRWHVWLKKAIFLFVRVTPSLLAVLEGLSFIHFARWAVIKRNQWPDLGPDQVAIESAVNRAPILDGGLQLVGEVELRGPHRSQAESAKFSLGRRPAL